MTPAFTNLGDLIRRDRDLGKLAIIDLGGETERRFTYADLDAMARGVARALTARGFARGEKKDGERERRGFHRSNFTRNFFDEATALPSRSSAGT